jgi:hypothetical protein
VTLRDTCRRPSKTIVSSMWSIQSDEVSAVAASFLRHSRHRKDEIALCRGLCRYAKTPNSPLTCQSALGSHGQYTPHIYRLPRMGIPHSKLSTTSSTNYLIYNVVRLTYTRGLERIISRVSSILHFTRGNCKTALAHRGIQGLYQCLEYSTSSLLSRMFPSHYIVFVSLPPSLSFVSPCTDKIADASST